MDTTMMDKDDAPNHIGPEQTVKKTFADRGRSLVKAFTTREGLIGTYVCQTHL